MRATLVLFGVLFTSACGSTGLLPDGGRPRQHCAGSVGNVPVKVTDASGNAIEGVDVTATHSGTQAVVSSKTDVNGNTRILLDDLGQGTIHVVAQLGSRRDLTDITVSCGECICTSYPATVTLTPQ